MSEKDYKDFVSDTEHIDYNDCSVIVNKFNKSVEQFKRFKEYHLAGDYELAGSFLQEAGTSIYQCCEWALKHYLRKTFNRKANNNEIPEYRAAELRITLEDKKTTIHDLIELFEQYSEPEYSVFDIKTGEIKRRAEETNNKPKHIGTIPKPEQCLLIIAEVRKIIHNYIDSEASLDIVDDSLYSGGNQWEVIFDHTDRFNNWFSYILVCNSIKEAYNAKGLFSVKWDLVLDFDPASEVNGLYKEYIDVTAVHPKIRTLEPIDANRQFKQSTTPYWIMANGTIDNPDSIENDPKKWRSRYGRFLSNSISEFNKTYSKPAKVFIYNIDNERTLDKVVDDFYDIYEAGEDIEFFVIEPNNQYARIEHENFKRMNLSFTSFCDNLSMSLFSSNGRKAGGISVPVDSGVKKVLEPNFIAQLQDSFEIIYEGIEDDCDEAGEDIARDFYRGANVISWTGLAEGVDVIRETQHRISDMIDKNLKEKARALKIIMYEPGVGGTTLLRRLAWEFCGKTPTLILGSYSAEETCHSVQKLYDLTHLPILIFVDSNTIELDEARALQTELKKLGFKFVICYFQRKMDRVNEQAAGIVGPFSGQEALEMAGKLDRYIERQEIRKDLIQICESVDSIDRTPFIMSMHTFLEDFRGTKPFIGYFLNNANEQIKKILFAVSIVDFGNVKLPLQYFGNTYQGSSVEDFMREIYPRIEKLVRIETIGEKQFIRIRYHQFGKEILRQLSYGFESEAISFTNLVDNILGFIEDSRNKRFGYAQEELDVMRTLFITRAADVDSERPVFSTLIEKLRSERKTNISGVYDESNDVIERIFNKLVDVYPEEPHFAAHLARYYFYIERNYEKGFHFIKTAIELSEMIDNKVDPLLLHMKAMGYSSRITNTLIRDVNRAIADNDSELLRDTLEEIEENAENAFVLFEKVRKSSIGIAGHVSDIVLCIAIANMAKNLMEETDYMHFVSSSKGEWALKYIDRATMLWDECKSMANDSPDEDLSLSRIEIRLRDLTNTLQESILLWEDYVAASKGKNLIRARRVLAQAYNKKINQTKENDNQAEIARIVELMENNMNEDPDNPANIRIWFEAIQRLIVDDPDELMRDAVLKLNRWVILTDSVEAHFYRFILKFLLALAGSSGAEEDLRPLLRELKAKAANEYNRTATRYWLMNTGQGLSSLMKSSRNNRESFSDDEMVKRLKSIVGRISNDYVNDVHAYIRWRGIDIYFNPSSTRGEIDKSKVNQLVKFGVGFSYDGPRAFNTSIRIAGTEDVPIQPIQLRSGIVVKCEVIKQVEYHVKVRIIGADEENGSIHINELKSPYSSKNRPDLGQLLDVQVIGEAYDGRRQERIWRLTMFIEGEEDAIDGDEETTMERAFKKANNKKQMDS